MTANRGPLPDCYDYVRRYYGVPAYIGVRVQIGSRTGVLAKPRGAGDQYLHVRFDDNPRRVEGPYHPTDGVTFVDVATR